MTAKLPVVIILGKGADPNSEIRELAKAEGHWEGISTVSLGTGTEKRSTTLLNQGMKLGLWVVL